MLCKKKSHLYFINSICLLNVVHTQLIYTAIVNKCCCSCKLLYYVNKSQKQILKMYV